MITDTDFIIDLMNNDESAVSKFEQLTSKNEPILVTPITIFELFTGIIRSKRPDEEKKKVVKTLSQLINTPLDKITAEKAGEIHGNLILTGNNIGALDCIIAATSINKNQKLITKNIKPFSTIKDLKKETYKKRLTNVK